MADGFDTFWQLYPRKVGKVKAQQSWKKINPDDELTAKICRAVIQQKYSPQWTKDNGQFIPHPTTWLNQRRWEDEIESPGSMNNVSEETTAIEEDLDAPQCDRCKCYCNCPPLNKELHMIECWDNLYEVCDECYEKLNLKGGQTLCRKVS